jgi:hypothetical protein
MGEEQGYYCYDKRSGQIPAFGNWEYANDLPITQYFECARQAGLFRYSNPSSGECAAAGLYVARRDLYAGDNFKKKPPQKQKTTGGSNKNHVIKKQQKQLSDVTEPPWKQQLHLPNDGNKTASNYNNNNTATARTHNRRQPTRTTTPTVVRTVDEDLYKIPPDLLHACKRKRRLGFFSRCLVPDCMV